MSHTPARSGSHLARLRVIAGDVAPYPEDYLAQVRHSEVRSVLDLVDVLADAVQYAERYDTTIDPGTIRALLTDFGAHLEPPEPHRPAAVLPPTAAVEAAPVVATFPTMNSGLVVRWYASPATGWQPLASASRDGYSVPGIVTDPAVGAVAAAVAAYLREVVYRGAFGTSDRDAYAAVEALATHRSHFASSELTPLHGGQR